MLQDFLDAKPLFYDKIDYARMPKIYERIKEQLPSPQIIHLIGTNGKGTTGRFLASALNSLALSVGHYTSPHILKFNERIWLNGDDVSDTALELAHTKLQNILHFKESQALSYFEYTTLLCIIIFKECDYVVMEAGLGGEHDATAVFEKTLTLVTPIAIDHEAFLGDTIRDIATTKLNAITKEAILAKQSFLEVYEVAEDLTNMKNILMHRVDDVVDTQDIVMIQTISKELALPPYLQDNLKLAIAGLKSLGLEYKKEDFLDSRLFGRVSKFRENIIVDVGHNTLAATSILNALEGKKYVLIYNSYKDKDYKQILAILKPMIKRVEIICIESQRALLVDKLQTTLNELRIQWSMYKGVEPEEEYLVFGSFSVVEAFLKEFHG
jgi:dihydrofolate synthase/folylpolyglutamate synthase